MKTITEEQRQWMIDYGKRHQSILESIIAREEDPVIVEGLKIAKAFHEAGLASLTADVFMHGISDPDGKPYFSEYCVDDDGSSVSDEVCALNDGETDCIGGYRVAPLYTTPPVPVIELPDSKDRLNPAHCTADIYLQGKGDGWNECLAEIKRLNGLGD